MPIEPNDDDLPDVSYQISYKMPSVESATGSPKEARVVAVYDLAPFASNGPRKPRGVRYRFDATKGKIEWPSVEIPQSPDSLEFELKLDWKKSPPPNLPGKLTWFVYYTTGEKECQQFEVKSEKIKLEPKSSDCATLPQQLGVEKALETGDTFIIPPTGDPVPQKV